MLLKLIRLILVVLEGIFEAEKHYGPKHGAKKKEDVYRSVGLHMGLEPMFMKGDGWKWDEFVLLVGNLIDAIVALLNFFGLLNGEEPPKPPPKKGG